MSGQLITLEGGEGAGKSTVHEAVVERLRAHDLSVVTTREPGGTPLGEAVRDVALTHYDEPVCAAAELLLMFAARAQLLADVIRPALARGDWVVSDRYVDASYAYQGGGRQLPKEWVADLDRRVVGDCQPGLTLLLDLPVAQGRARANLRSEQDRIEAEAEDFFERVRSTYRQRAAAQPLRFCVIDASMGVDDVRAAACSAIDRFVAVTMGAGH